MPFVNPNLRPELRTHLSDQWHAANDEFKELIEHNPDKENVSPEEQEVLDRLYKLQRDLLGK